MNRDKRKANLRKLQLPASTNADTGAATTTRRLRTPASTNSGESPCVSDHFSANASKDSSKEPQRKLKRPSLSSFIGLDPKDPQQNGEDAAKRLSDDFEVPEKKTKRAPTLKRHAAKPKAKIKSSSKSRQTNIKSAFLRNEEAFAEIAAQHSASDNFSAEEMLLALAISKSESGNVDEGDEAIVDLIGSDSEARGEKNQVFSSQDSIRTKLQKYGYRVAPKGEYNLMASACVPQRRGKARWASKFTALTLRDPQVQAKKLHGYVEGFLARQYYPGGAPTDDSLSKEQAYKLCSRSLARRQVFPDCSECVVQKQFTDLEDYFVSELFEVSRLNAGHLLKDWSVIQGRDQSPLRRDARTRDGERVLKRVYAELEQCFGQQLGSDTTCGMNTSNSENASNIVESCQTTEKREEDLIDDMNRDAIEIKISPLETHVDHTQSVAITNATENGQQNLEEDDMNKDVIVIDTSPLLKTPHNTPSVGLTSPHSPDSQHTASPEEKSKAFANLTNRPTSPDLFAESDEEKENCMVDLNDATDCIESFEIFSSDEDIRAVDEPKVTRDVICEILDVSLDVSHTKGANEGDGSEEVLEDGVAVQFPTNSPERHSMGQILTEEDAFETDYLDLNEIASEGETRSCTGEVEIISSLEDKSSDVAVESTICKGEVEIIVGLDGKSGDVAVGASKGTGHIECVGPALENFNNISMPISDDIIDVDENHLRHINLSPTKTSMDNNSSIHRSSSNKNDSLQSKRSVTSFTEHLSEASIDLTQNDDENEGLMLSDDEINYSIWRSDNRRKSMKPPVEAHHEGDIDDINPNQSGEDDDVLVISSNSECEEDSHDVKEFSLIDFIHEDDEEPNVIEGQDGETNDDVATDVDGDQLMRLDEDPVLSQQKDDLNDILADASFVASPSANAAKFMKRYSSSLKTRKFSNLLEDIRNEKDNEAEDGFDEFDNLVYGFPQRLPQRNEEIVESIGEKNGEYDSAKKDQGLVEDFTAYRNDDATTVHSIENGNGVGASNGYEFDEFDCLVYGSEKLLNPGEPPDEQQGPQGLNKLLTSQIFASNDLMHSRSNPKPESSTLSGSGKVNEQGFQEHRINDRVYQTRLVKGPPTDYERMADEELLRHLSGYGVKPMQRKHAVKLLTYIYQQTHIPVKPEDVKAMEPHSGCPTAKDILAKTKSMPIMSRTNTMTGGSSITSSQQVNNRFTETTSGLTKTTSGLTNPTSGLTKTTSGLTKTTSGLTKTTSGLTKTTSGLTKTTSGLTKTTSGLTKTTSSLTKTTSGLTKTTSGLTKATSGLTNPTICDSDAANDDKSLKIQLSDNLELDLTRFSGDLTADLLPPEQCILQTNLRKTTAQPLVPLHIAWYNMVCANPVLHEAILTYQPIDLQDVYMHMKSLGYRYEPKDLKTFCDQRCIIFRYDLKPTVTEGKNRLPGRKNKPLSLTQK